MLRTSPTAGGQYHPEQQAGALNLMVLQEQQQPDEAVKRAGNRLSNG
jgi:hypothetical protein